MLRAQWPGYLDVAGQVHLTPDLVWQRSGHPLAVIDAKYKVLRPAAFPHADLYQMFAYCTVLVLPLGRLVYAAGEEQPIRHVVRRTSTTIETCTLDLSKPIPDLLAHVKKLAAEIADTRPNAGALAPSA